MSTSSANDNSVNVVEGTKHADPAPDTVAFAPRHALDPSQATNDANTHPSNEAVGNKAGQPSPADTAHLIDGTEDGQLPETVASPHRTQPEPPVLELPATTPSAEADRADAQDDATPHAAQTHNTISHNNENDDGDQNVPRDGNGVHLPEVTAPASETSSEEEEFFERTDSDEMDSRGDDDEAAHEAGERAETVESLSFFEDESMSAYDDLIPSAHLSSAAQSVQFRSECDSTDMESLSFATLQTIETAVSYQVLQTEGGGDDASRPGATTATTAAPPPPTAAAAALSLPPLAHMTARQRVKYYMARDKRKQKLLAELEGRPQGEEAEEVKKTKKKPRASQKGGTEHPPAALLSTATGTPSATAAKPVRLEKKAPQTAGSADTAGGDEAAVPPAAHENVAAPSDREVQLALLVQQLQGDVQRLLLQARADSSRIAALRGSLSGTQREYRTLQAAHATSVMQLQAWAAQMAAGKMAAPQPEEEREKEEEAHDDGHNAHAEVAPEDGEAEGEVAEAVGAEAAVADGAATEAAEGHVSGGGDREAAAVAVTPAAPPVQGLHKLSEEECRALLRQVGYVHHNRLLRRENLLLMHQLRLLQEQARGGKRHKMTDARASTLTGSQRLQVVVRIRPVGLASGPRDEAALAVSEAGSVRAQSVGSPVAPLLASATDAAHGSPLSPTQQQQQQQSAAMAAQPPTEMFLQYSAAENKLQVRNPEVVTGRDGSSSATAVRGARIFGPPLPQSIASLPPAAFSPSSTITAPPTMAVGVAGSAGEREQTPATAVCEERCSGDAGVLRAAAAGQQRSLYQEVVAPLVDGVVAGASATVVAYGQVGSGKTYTLFGSDAFVSGKKSKPASERTTTASSVFAKGAELPPEAGVVPRAIADLFDRLSDKAASQELLLRSLHASRHDATFQATLAGGEADEAASLAQLAALARTPVWELQCTMVELYGEKARDLLAPKITLPVYEEFVASSGGVKGSGGFRSSSAERRAQRHVRDAQAAAQHRARDGGHGAAPTKAADKAKGEEEQWEGPPRKLLGYESLSPECPVRVDEKGGARVEGATVVTLHSLEQALQVLQGGLASRKVHETAANAQSSRSHVMVTLTLKQQQWVSTDAAPEKEKAARASASEAKPKETAAKPKATKNASEKKSTKSAAKPKRATKATAAPPGEPAQQTTAKPSKKKAAKAQRTPVQRETSGEPSLTLADDNTTSDVNTAAEVEAQEDAAHSAYLRRRAVKAVTSCLVFVDLAGTDRSTAQHFMAGSDGAERLREAQAISKGLSALGDVMAVLHGGSGVGPKAYVPFRSHKLTSLLRDALVTPQTCVVLGCLALSEGPMTALLSDAAAPTNTIADALAPLSASPTSAFTQEGREGEVQYWRQAAERVLEGQRRPSKAPATHRTGDGGELSGRTSARRSTRLGSLQSTLSLSTTASPTVAGTKAARHSVDATLQRSFMSPEPSRIHGGEEEDDVTAQLQALQAGAEAEERAAAAALWITPRETLSTLLFLSRLRKA